MVYGIVYLKTSTILMRRTSKLVVYVQRSLTVERWLETRLGTVHIGDGEFRGLASTPWQLGTVVLRVRLRNPTGILLGILLGVLLSVLLTIHGWVHRAGATRVGL